MMKRMYLFSLFYAVLLLFSCENPETDTGTNSNLNPGSTVPVKRVTVTPNTAEVVKGETKNFTATVEGTGETPSQSVTWSIAGAHAGGTGISTAGILAIAEDESALTLTVKATSTADTERHGSATVSITEKPSVVKVEITPQTITLAATESYQFTAVVEVTGNAEKTVSWSLTENQKPGTTLSPSGLLRIAEDEPAGGTLTVTVKSTVDPTKTAASTVTTMAWLIPFENLVGTIWQWEHRAFYFDTETAMRYHRMTSFGGSEPEILPYPYTYTYNAERRSGEIEVRGSFTISADGKTMFFPNYTSYGHTATFTKVDEPQPW